MTTNTDTSIPPQLPGPQPTYPNLHWLMFIIFPYVIIYSVLGIWLLFDGYLNHFQSIYFIWGLETAASIPDIFKLALFSVVGAIIGCGTLDILSFHKYIAIKKTFDVDHTWGFFFSPVLAAIIGLIVFALFQSGLLIFSGNVSSNKETEIPQLGFTAIGFISGYSWHDVVEKFRDLSKGFFKNSTSQKDKTITSPSSKDGAAPDPSNPLDAKDAKNDKVAPENLPQSPDKSTPKD